MKDGTGNTKAAAAGTTHTGSEAELVAFSHWINRLDIKYTGQTIAKTDVRQSSEHYWHRADTEQYSNPDMRTPRI